MSNSFQLSPGHCRGFFSIAPVTTGEPGFAPRYMVPARMTTTMVAASISQLMTGLLARVSQLSMGPVRLARLSQELSNLEIYLACLASLVSKENPLPTAGVPWSMLDGQLDEEPDGYRPVDQRERGNLAWLGFAAPLSQSA